MPRNVVTLSPRSDLFGRRRGAQESVVAAPGERLRFRRRGDVIEIDFPKRLGGRQAKAEVAAELDRIDPEWRRLFRLYPTEDSLRGRA